MTVKETYEKWKHLDDQLSDAQYMAGPTASFQKLLLFDLWQAVKAEATSPQDELVRLRKQLERIRTWTPVSCRACPLCTYHLGKILALCEWHQECAQNEQDASRWRAFASSPQTALMLGSRLDPNDESIDWLAECNRLADASAWMATEKQCIAPPPPSYTDGQRDERERIVKLLYAPERTLFVCDDKEHIYNEDEVRKLLSQEVP